MFHLLWNVRERCGTPSTSNCTAGAAMEMKIRGWHEERVVWAMTTTGERIPIVTGRTTYEGRDVAVLAIGNGPSAILDGDASQLRVNIAATTDDARRAGR